MFHHIHPYPPYNLAQATKIIVGTLPPPRFTTRDYKAGDVDFCYGSINGQLWPILDRIFKLNLIYENTPKAIEQRKSFLIEQNIGVCDIVASARREKIDASDLGMQNVQLRPIFRFLAKHKQINTLLFTGGNSKNGPEYFFRRKAKEHGIILQEVSALVPRIYQFEWASRTIKTVSLTVPSGAANRAVGAMHEYKEMKAKDPDMNTLDYRIYQYRPYFMESF